MLCSPMSSYGKAMQMQEPFIHGQHAPYVVGSTTENSLGRCNFLEWGKESKSAKLEDHLTEKCENDDMVFIEDSTTRMTPSHGLASNNVKESEANIEEIHLISMPKSTKNPNDDNGVSTSIESDLYCVVDPKVDDIVPPSNEKPLENVRKSSRERKVSEKLKQSLAIKTAHEVSKKPRKKARKSTTFKMMELMRTFQTLPLMMPSIYLWRRRRLCY
ncbi:hypothetical protein L7F22_066017 [Adiantum nelumboides]|nr:hypothetical protein [Adiantum nelumboides]